MFKICFNISFATYRTKYSEVCAVIFPRDWNRVNQASTAKIAWSDHR